MFFKNLLNFNSFSKSNIPKFINICDYCLYTTSLLFHIITSVKPFQYVTSKYGSNITMINKNND